MLGFYRYLLGWGCPLMLGFYRYVLQVYPMMLVSIAICLGGYPLCLGGYPLMLGFYRYLLGGLCFRSIVSLRGYVCMSVSANMQQPVLLQQLVEECGLQSAMR